MRQFRRCIRSLPLFHQSEFQHRIKRKYLGVPLSFFVLLLTISVGTAHSKNHAVIVSGLGGTPEYNESFVSSATQVYEGLQSLDINNDTVTLLSENATKADILAAISASADRMGSSDDSFSLVLIGHGTADAETWKFNVRGPDLTTEDLVAALNAIPTQKQLVVLAASSSGAALEVLKQPQRVVITATKSGGESNAVRFPEYFASAFATALADFDRNEILTVAEAYRFADSKTVEHYENQDLLASEHSRLSGERAKDTPLALLGSLRGAADDPVVADLLNDRLELEAQFFELTARKPAMAITDYYNELESLLIKISRLQQSLDAATGWNEDDTES